MRKYHYNPTKPHHYLIQAITIATTFIGSMYLFIYVCCFFAIRLGGAA